MSFVERRETYRPATGEAPFEVSELFFSRTDERGVIQAANYIFKRVSGYEWKDLLGAPQKVTHHPDMPKGVFWLFWDALNKDRSVGAYIKNRASDGLYYWVFALAMPIQGGYLSVWMKPTSKLLAFAEEKYESLRKAEVEDGVSAEESAAILLQDIQVLGYEDYLEFSSDALAQELAARDLAMGQEPPGGSDLFQKMLTASDDLQTETAALSAGFEAIGTVPTNMRIIAARLEPSGGAVSALAQNYWEMSEEMSRWFQDYVSGADSNFSAIRKKLVCSQFYCGISQVMSEVALKFSAERRSLGSLDVDNEKALMSEKAATLIEKANAGLAQVVEEVEQTLRAIAMMRRFALGLSSTRVMCNIESARLPAGGGSLIDVIDQLAAFQKNLDAQMDAIEEQCHTIEGYSQTLAKGEGG